MRVLALLLLAFSACLPHWAHAGGGPENLFLIVNADSPESLEVANTYIRLRNIPPNNVLYLSGIPAGIVLEVDAFREKILLPIQDAIAKRGLAPQIDYVIYSTNFPHGVNGAKDAAALKLPQVFTRRASLTSLTYLHELVLQKNPDYYQLTSNYYFRKPLFPDDSAEWTAAERQAYENVSVELEKFQNLRRQIRDREKTNAKNKTDGKPEVPAPANEPDPKTMLAAAAEQLGVLLKGRPSSPAWLYDFACIQAQQGLADEAMKTLQRAIDNGWKNKAHMKRDRDLNSLRERPDFKQMLAGMGPFLFDTQPTAPFRHEYGWDKSGAHAATGRHYWLSTMLGTIGPKANTLDEVQANLERTAQADGTAPKGTFYFMANDDIRSTTREWAFEAAVDQLKKLGLSAELLPGVIPKDATAVAGASIGISNFDWAGSKSTMLPGAIAEHLTSCGGMIEGTGQTNVSEFMRYGAGGSSGTVEEPYAIQNKFPNAFIQVHYARGASLAEAFYQTVYGPYQLLIVGDPLCQPWAVHPEVKMEGLSANEVLKDARTIKVSTTAPVVAWAFYVDGVRMAIDPASTFKLDPETLSDGWHELRAVCLSGPLETQGAQRVPFTVQRKGRAVSVEGAPTAALAADAKVTLKAGAPGAQKLVLKHESLELQQTPGEKGEWTLTPKECGFGVAKCWIEAVYVDAPEKIVRSAPVEVQFKRK